MTRLSLARNAAYVIIIGHVFLFMYGLLVAGLGGFLLIDVAQMILMGSPILALTSVAAFEFLIGEFENDGRAQEVGDKATARLIIGICVCFILALFFTYSLAFKELFTGSTANPETVKIATGAIETVLGAFIGIIRDRLFLGRPRPQTVNGGPTNEVSSQELVR